MRKILSLSIFQQKKEVTIEDKNIEVLLPELPFYGIGGTIYRIEEAPESYYKVLYNQDGTINSRKIPVPKKKNKNFDLILKDYCEDLKNYLDKFQHQYLDCEKNAVTPVLTDKQFFCLAIVTIVASIISIPFLFTTVWFGLILELISGLSLYIVCDIHKKDVSKVNSYNVFKKQYKMCQRDLANYRSGKPICRQKNEETVYTNINNVDKSYLKFFPKIKILMKDEYSEVA